MSPIRRVVKSILQVVSMTMAVSGKRQILVKINHMVKESLKNIRKLNEERQRQEVVESSVARC
jgi:hypothetical protein